MESIPREIIKWIQSLELTYEYTDKLSNKIEYNQNDLYRVRNKILSFKDIKRDLFNGYFIAAIIKKYMPLKINLHSFENSNSKKYIKNNWKLLNSIFLKENKKFNLINISDNEEIVNGNFEKLVDFLINLYECFTKRVIKKNEFIKNIKELNKSLKNKENTEAYLLTNNNVYEKLDKKDNIINEEESNKEEIESKNIINNSRNKSNYFGKKELTKNVSIRPIKKNSINNKELFNSMNVENSLKNGFFENQNETFYNENKKEEEYKLINEKINIYIIDLINSDNAYSKYLDILEVNSQMLYLIFAENINEFDENFISWFFEKIEENHNKNSDFSNILIKDLNELWKYIYFLLTALKSSHIEGNNFFYFFDYLCKFIEILKQKDMNKIILFYNEFISELLCKLIKTCNVYEKRVYFIKLIYIFNKNDESSKHNCIRDFKEKINNNEIFLQSLHILLDEEEEWNSNNIELIKEFKYYIKIGISHISKNIRLSTLAIIRSIYHLKPNFVEKFIIKNEKKINIFDWWELKAVTLTIISKILEKNFQSDYYKNLKKNSNQIMKNINDENNNLNIKEIINFYINLTVKIINSDLTENVKKVFLIYFVLIITESNKLLELYIEILLEINDDLREWILFKSIFEKNDIEEKCFVDLPYTLFYKTNIDNEILKKQWCEILIATVNIIKNKKEFDYRYVSIIQFCFDNANFSKINVEHFDFISNNIFDYILYGLTQNDIKDNCFDFLKVFIIYSIKGEIIIKEFESKLLEHFLNIFNKEENNEYVINENIQFLAGINNEFPKENPFHEKYLEFYDYLSKGLESNIKNKEIINWIIN